ncbi:hypothetical protein BKA65DRAFT_502951 [Rhexocercosporidium sp. MPI-PUGE-AT-0058]|nr:hypothetical protein BKA65DRAFT_502951 [Rhexocercosporidium sp. MPI-PUGE-AT-0058]
MSLRRFVRCLVLLIIPYFRSKPNYDEKRDLLLGDVNQRHAPYSQSKIAKSNLGVNYLLLKLSSAGNNFEAFLSGSPKSLSL